MEQLRRQLAGLLELPGRTRNLPMEGLRGIAVSLVFLVHYQSLFGSWTQAGTFEDRAARFCAEIGHSGVDLFFVLSGYLIYGAVIQSRRFSYREFMKRRLVRIYPTFLVMLVTYLVLSRMIPMESKLPAETGAQILYVLQNALMLPGMFDIRPIMTVAWSLSYEVFFYAAIPLIVTLLGMKAWRRGHRLAAFGALAAGFSVLSWRGAGHIQLVLFASGIFVYELRRAQEESAAQRASRWRGAVYALVLAVLPVAFFLQEAPSLFSWSTVSGAGFMMRTLWLSLAFAIITFAAFSPAGSLPRALSFTPLRWLGNMSYSYYLVHGLALKGVALVVHHFAAASGAHRGLFWLSMPVVFLGTICASGVVFAVVEKRLSLAPVPRPLPESAARAAV